MKFENSKSMEITKKANEMKQEDDQVIILSIGDSHFNPPQQIMDKAHQAINNEKTHYMSAKGLLGLRKNISKFYFSETRINEGEVIIVPGLKTGLFFLLKALQKKRVCLLEPYWLGYKHIANLLDYDYITINMHKKGWLNKLREKNLMF